MTPDLQDCKDGVRRSEKSLGGRSVAHKQVDLKRFEFGDRTLQVKQENSL
jgi:hypothetical protein